MTADSNSENIPELKELTAEELQLVLDAGAELAKINSALAELNEVYLAKWHAETISGQERAIRHQMYASPVYRGLLARRSELRQLLLDLGEEG